jgi:hypothetical protein
LKLQCLKQNVFRTIGNCPRGAPIRELHTAPLAWHHAEQITAMRAVFLCVRLFERSSIFSFSRQQALGTHHFKECLCACDRENNTELNIAVVKAQEF